LVRNLNPEIPEMAGTPESAALTGESGREDEPLAADAGGAAIAERSLLATERKG
jgi:hypothetical protein